MKQIKSTTLTMASGIPAVLSVAELTSAEYEVMLASPDFGAEYAVLRSSSIDTAMCDYNHLLKRYSVEKVAGKYAKLADDLAMAVKIGLEAAEKSSDGGTCNFDSLCLDLKGWNKSKVEAAAKKAGIGCFVWSLFGCKRYVFPLAAGQGDARTDAAESMRDFFQNAGYSASVYYQID